MAQTRSYLLDTQIFIWWLDDSQRLKKSVRKILANPNYITYLSIASLWEMAIKRTKGKLQLSRSLEWIVNNSGFNTLSIELNHILKLEKLPSLHGDPFDRILISQAQTENLTLITSDSKIWQYDVNLIKVK